MNFLELLKIILRNIQRRKLRSFLTILGIIIGTSIFVVIYNLGKSMEENITYTLERNLGSDVITILPIQFGRRVYFGGATRTTLLFTTNDIEKIKKIEGVDSVYGVYTATLPIKFKKEEYNLNVQGVYGLKDWEKIEVERIGIYNGRFIENSFEAVVGYRAAKEFFEKEISVGDKIIIGNKTFKVVGILNEAGGVLSSIDRSIFILYEDLEKLTNVSNQISIIVIKVRKNFDIENVGKEIHELLIKLRKEEEGKETFSVITPAFYRNIVSETVTTISIFMLAIASVSIIVGSIGISNTMFTSVLERTKEIGILKAIGARKSDILKLFLFESAIIGLIGSAIGCLIGVLFSFGIQKLMQTYVTGDFTARNTEAIIIIEPISILISLMIGFISGIMAGYFPARRAANLEAIEALRYE
ncbi:MAG: ABC transporter permease [Candidatus Aenigmatarchaeota archaeon]